MKPKKTELAILLSQIHTWEWSASSEMYPDVDQKVREFHKLFAQIDILQQKLNKIWSRDIMICKRVLVIRFESRNQILLCRA